MESTPQHAVIVGVQLQNETNFAYAMEELRNLAAACNIKVIGELSQKASRINPSHYIGTGKIQELSLMLEDEDTLVIFNDELTPSQIRNLESSLDRQVIDRTILILNIFAERAKTKEAQLQVEVAQLQYMLPRLTGMRESLGRQGGGAGLKNRGPVKPSWSWTAEELKNVSRHCRRSCRPRYPGARFSGSSATRMKSR